MSKTLIGVLGAAAAILCYQIFIPPVVGLADQGDFVRTIVRFGYAPQHHGTLEYQFVEPKYVPEASYRSPYWEQANSEYLFVGTALLVNRLVSKDGALDITVMGFVHLIAFLAAFARLLWVARRHRSYLLIWIAAPLIMTDAGYAVYFNSFYAEPASCFFCLLLMAESIEIGIAGEVSLVAMLRWVLWAVLWIFAKPQNTPIGLLLGLFTLRLILRAPARWTKITAIAGAAAMFGCAAYNVIAMPRVGHMANTYGMVFSGVLGDSKDPAADLRALGLDPKLAAYAGSGAWTPNTAFVELAKSGVLERDVSTFTVLRFYLLHPARMWRRLQGVLPQITFLRRNWYGNFEPSAGLPPAAQSQAFTLWSYFHERMLPHFNKWIVFALMAWPIYAAWLWFHAADAASRLRIEFVGLLPIACLGALFGAVFGDAFDLIKHMYLFNLLLDACLLYAAASAWKAVRR